MSEQFFVSEAVQASFDLFDNNVVEMPTQTFHLVPAPLPEKAAALPNIVNVPLEVVTRLAQPDAFACYGFAKDNPAKNCFRRYIITYQPSLWNDYTIFRQWGRIGSERLLSRTEHYIEATPAQKRVFRLIRRRLRRGYRLSFAA